MIKGKAIVVAVRKEGQGGDFAGRELLRRTHEEQMEAESQSLLNCNFLQNEVF